MIKLLSEDKLVLLEQEHQLRRALRPLTVEERLLIHELYYNGKSERELSAMIAVPQKTIHDRKRKILAKTTCGQAMPVYQNDSIKGAEREGSVPKAIRGGSSRQDLNSPQ